MPTKVWSDYAFEPETRFCRRLLHHKSRFETPLGTPDRKFCIKACAGLITALGEKVHAKKLRSDKAFLSSGTNNRRSTD